GTGGTSNPLDANAFGRRYRISDSELSGWRQDPAPTAFAVYTGDELITRIDGAADMYLNGGCRVSMFQDLVGPDPQICTVTAMDFGTNVNANSMFTYQRSNGASLAIPGYGTSAAIGLSTLGGMIAYAHFNSLYFEVQLSGFADTTSASAVAGQFLNVLRSKVAGSAVLPTGWDQARIGNTGLAWWLNAIKGAYFFDVKITPSAQYDTAGRATVIAFAQKVVGGLTSGMPAPVSLVPPANAIPGWTLDQNNPLTASGPAVATDNASATALIDGAADAFYDPSKSYQAKGLAWDVYANGTYSIDLKIWQMASAADAAQLYTDLLIEPLYANVMWTTCSGTDCPQDAVPVTVAIEPGVNSWAPTMSSVPGFPFKPVASGSVPANPLYRWRTDLGTFLLCTQPNCTVIDQGSDFTVGDTTVYWSYLSIPSDTSILVWIHLDLVDGSNGEVLAASEISLGWTSSGWVVVQ
ncbi:MAG TPA: DUF6599 family protein, partial [Polyangia bacterium]|nr:DUF6599 family protein [Polyangia bacterium]